MGLMTCLCCQYELALDQADGSRENLSAVNVIVEHIETGTSGREQNDISVLCQQKAYLYRLIHGGYPVYRYIAGLDGLCNFVCIPSQQYDTAHMLADWLFQREKSCPLPSPPAIRITFLRNPFSAATAEPMLVLLESS